VINWPLYKVWNSMVERGSLWPLIYPFIFTLIKRDNTNWEYEL
jgi:hypothetical protein